MSESRPETSVDEPATEPSADGSEPVAEEPTADGSEAREEPKKKGSFFRELPFLILIALVLALLIKAFLVQAFYIPSGSMENTLAIKDRVLVNKLVYDFRDPHRGEVVVFNGKDTGFCPSGSCQENQGLIAQPRGFFGRLRNGIQRVLGFGAPSEKDFIKRVIGLPGDVVACCDANGRVTVNGVGLDEPYIFNTSTSGPRTSTFTDCQGTAKAGACVVPKGQLFVMGDHRDSSSDSRINGTIPAKKVIGRAFVVIWPPSHAKGLRVPRSIERSNAMNVVAMSPPVLGLAGALPITLLRRRRRTRRAGRRTA
jgi:signal peptidase I